MSSASRSSSPTATSIDQEEPRKKGARGGKRSVTCLSKVQLVRKRAKDRETQRNIRQRTKENIEILERKVSELEEAEANRAGNMERVLARNRELEDEIEKLRAQINVQAMALVSTTIPQDIPQKLLLQHKVELDWMPGANATWPQASHIQAMPAETPILAAQYTDDTTLYPTAAGLSPNGTEIGQQIFSHEPQSISICNDPMVFRPQPSQCQILSKASPAWTPFYLA